MSKKKTALQQAMDDFDGNISYNGKVVKMMLRAYLKTERKQIEEAHSDSWTRSPENWEETPSEYYESTYETP